MRGTTATLRYLDATAVLSPAGELRDFQVSDTGGLSLGKLTGFVIDPRLVSSAISSWRSRAGSPSAATDPPLSRDARAAAPDGAGSNAIPPPRSEWREFDDRLFSRFSDDDLIDALFGDAPDGAAGPVRSQPS